jgi:hypothetical protein
VKLTLTLLLLLIAAPVHADDGGVVGTVISAVSSGMSNNNAGDPGYSGGDD